MARLLAALVCTFGMVALQQSPSDKAVDVSCELLATKHLAVQAMIDGKGPFRLIFDTGSPVVLLNQKVAKECKLNDPNRKRPERKPGTWPGQIILNSMEVGGIKAEGVPAAVLDHPTLKAIEAMTGPVDGIIGFPFYSRFKTTIDYSALKLGLTPTSYQPDDAVSAMMVALLDRNRGKVVRTIAPAGSWGLTLSKAPGDTASGIEVTKVFEGSAAAGAGLQAGDRIISIDGRWTDSEDDAYRAAAQIPAGQEVRVSYQRQGRDQSTVVRPRPGI